MWDASAREVIGPGGMPAEMLLSRMLCTVWGSGGKGIGKSFMMSWYSHTATCTGSQGNAGGQAVA